MMKYGVFFIIVGVLLGWFGRAYIVKPPEPIEIVEYIKAEPIIVERIEARLDTIYVEKETLVVWDGVVDEEVEEVFVAHVDTVFEGYGFLGVDYYSPPLNLFDFTLEPEPQKVIKTLPPKPRFYETKTAMLVYGALFTGTVVWLVK